MRYYDIKITDPTSGTLIREYTSFSNNQTNIAALDIELDLPTTAFAQPAGNAFARIWGIPLSDISQASDLNGMAVSIFGGMQKGLPLANPAQAGLLVQGYIYQAFGNWINTEQTLDLILTPAPTKIQPTSFVFNWQKGQSLPDALTSMLGTAYPGFTPTININPMLVLQQNEIGHYTNLVSFAQYIKARTAAIIGGSYPGIDIFMSQAGFSIYDGSVQTAPIQLAFQDIIGQPTWIDTATVQTKFVMRADLKIGQFVKFPQSLTTSAANTTAPTVNQKLTFQGTFMLNLIRHFGKFRQASADAWVTVVNASTTPVGAS